MATEGRPNSSDLSAKCNTKPERSLDGDSCAAPTSGRRPKRPDMQIYVPRGRLSHSASPREITTEKQSKQRPPHVGMGASAKEAVSDTAIHTQLPKTRRGPKQQWQKHTKNSPTKSPAINPADSVTVLGCDGQHTVTSVESSVKLALDCRSSDINVETSLCEVHDPGEIKFKEDSENISEKASGQAILPERTSESLSDGCSVGSAAVDQNLSAKISLDVCRSLVISAGSPDCDVDSRTAALDNSVVPVCSLSDTGYRQENTCNSSDAMLSRSTDTVVRYGDNIGNTSVDRLDNGHTSTFITSDNSMSLRHQAGVTQSAETESPVESESSPENVTLVKSESFVELECHFKNDSPFHKESHSESVSTLLANCSLTQPAGQPTETESASVNQLSPGSTASSAVDLQHVSDDESWDVLYDDSGEALNADVQNQLTAVLGKVKVQQARINYHDFQLSDPDLPEERYGHLIEIYGFPAQFKTQDLLMAFNDFHERGFDIKWVDDTHAIGVFSSAIAAKEALTGFYNPVFKVRPIGSAERQTKLKAKQCSEFIQPYRPRPETTASVARNLVANALGLRAHPGNKKDKQERQKLKDARERKRQTIQEKSDAWDGTIGHCAMDSV